jgi:hypothetical protein
MYCWHFRVRISERYKSAEQSVTSKLIRSFKEILISILALGYIILKAADDNKYLCCCLRVISLHGLEVAGNILGENCLHLQDLSETVTAVKGNR